MNTLIKYNDPLLIKWLTADINGGFQCTQFSPTHTHLSCSLNARLSLVSLSHCLDILALVSPFFSLSPLLSLRVTSFLLDTLHSVWISSIVNVHSVPYPWPAPYSAIRFSRERAGDTISSDPLRDGDCLSGNVKLSAVKNAATFCVLYLEMFLLWGNISRNSTRSWADEWQLF